MAVVLPNGIGETLGDSLVIGGVLQTTGLVIYVHHTGDDAYTGLNKAQPKATLAGAQTAASSGDIVVLLDGHTEAYTAALTLSKNLVIVGSGSSNGIPTVNFQKTSGAAAIFIITGAGLQLRNIKIKSNFASLTTNRVSVQASNVGVIGCYFECGANDPTAAALQVDASLTNVTIKNCTFVSTATAAAATPGAGVEISGASTDLVVSGCVFDGGAVGFNGGIAYEEQGAPTRRRGEQNSLLRGADLTLSAAAVQSFWQTSTATGDARVTS